MSEKEKRYLTIQEAAEYLSVSPGTLYNRVAPGSKNPFPVQPERIGRLVRFDRERLDRFMASE